MLLSLRRDVIAHSVSFIRRRITSSFSKREPPRGCLRRGMSVAFIAIRVLIQPSSRPIRDLARAQDREREIYRSRDLPMRRQPSEVDGLFQL